MMFATITLSLMSFCSVVLQHMLLPSFDRGNPEPSGEAPPASPQMPPPPPPPQLSDEDAQEAFLELVKRRASIQTPLDTSFWRPYVRKEGKAAPKVESANQTQLIFVAGAEGTGHHFITALMMRLPALMPMTLVQEQAFQALWWNPKSHDPAVFWSAIEAFSEWVRAARSAGKHPAFCARSCLRLTGQKHCSWVGGLQLQKSGRLLDGRGHNGSFQPVGQMFSYPFSRSWNETEDGTHYPEIVDLQYMCDLLGVRLRVLVLYRDPIDAIMSMNNRGLPKIWRRFGRTFKLHKQVALYLSQLDEMYTQLSILRSDDYRVLNYTNLLISPLDYPAPLSDFLQLPHASISRSFTLSIKAKPKKRQNTTGGPMDGGTTGAWSDEVRRAFITTRLTDARRSITPPACCDEWTGLLARSPVVRVDQAMAPRRPTHWFSKWASTAPPPLRAENISFTHVVNPFKGGQDSEHRLAQQTTLRSIAHAAALANTQGVRVDVVCVMYPEDNDPTASYIDICRSSGFTIALMNVSVHSTLPQFRHPVRLPFLNQILYAGWLHGKGRYLTYSNIDIGVQAPFYLKVARQLQLMPDTPLSLIREEFEHTPETFGVENALGWRGGGLGHPGHDCWTFPREWVPKLVLGFTMVGVSMVATDLMQALHAHSGCRMSLISPQLTFHYVTGDSVVKHPQNQRARNNQLFTGLYTAWNCAQFARNRHDVLKVHPSYAQCWFNHQAECARRAPPLPRRCPAAAPPLPRRCPVGSTIAHAPSPVVCPCEQGRAMVTNVVPPSTICHTSSSCSGTTRQTPMGRRSVARAATRAICPRSATSAERARTTARIRRRTSCRRYPAAGAAAHPIWSRSHC